MSANIKLWKTQLHKTGQSGGFLGRLSGLLLNTRLRLIGNVLKPLAKNILTPLALKAVASATDASTIIYKIMFGSSTTMLIISNDEMNDTIKIVKSVEQSGLLIKFVSETIKNRAKEQKGGFLGMLLRRLGASLWEKLLINKKALATSQAG